ncbi:hypothetical protein Patl1_17680 [Pistacia atlantica]|uniref:Uncharacterized protein n=1 Tax=Pistacia atlantica TaxID=434234 RepID=A0ACC1C1A0_9ROSI|nr:hypothetical protein Patl1_17680 [Pistacia atlantica]
MATTTTTTNTTTTTHLKVQAQPIKPKRRKYRETTISSSATPTTSTAITTTTTDSSDLYPTRKLDPPTIVSPDNSWCCPASKPISNPPPTPPQPQPQPQQQQRSVRTPVREADPILIPYSPSSFRIRFSARESIASHGLHAYLTNIINDNNAQRSLLRFSIPFKFQQI